jgi:hypothetical protein
MWLRIAMLEVEQIYRVERRRGIIALGPPPLAPEVVKTATKILGREDIAALGPAEPGRATG